MMLNDKKIQKGQYIKHIKRKNKNQNKKEISYGGCIIKCYPHFVLSQLPFYRECFHYNEIEVITHEEHQRLLKKQNKKVKSNG